MCCTKLIAAHASSKTDFINDVFIKNVSIHSNYRPYTYQTGKRHIPHPPPEVVEHDVLRLLLANTENIFCVFEE
jgi:hypothetical protein